MLTELLCFTLKISFCVCLKKKIIFTDVKLKYISKGLFIKKIYNKYYLYLKLN